MDEGVPARVREYADQAVTYVRRALGVTLEYDSDTLPVLDHYIRSLPTEGHAQQATTELVVATAGAYFGEVVRRRLGGRWEVNPDGDDYRMVLPTGLSFSPGGLVASSIAQADLEDMDSELDAPPRIRPHVQAALSRMGEVTEEEYYSLCGRLDTLEHVHEVLVAIAAKMMGDEADPDGGTEEDAPPEPVADEPSGPAIN